MRALAIFILSLLLVFGCATTEPTEQPPAQNISEPPLENITEPGNTTNITCEEHCPTLSHIQCVGEWNISGIYPDCECEFTCNTEEVQPEENITENETPEFSFPFTNQTLEEMITENLAELRSDFYHDHSGVFDVNTYTWKRIPSNASPGEITIDAAPASDIKFDDTVIQSVQASGFIVFENTGTEEINTFGFAIFSEMITMLDSYTGSDAFDIYYFQEIIDKNLYDCWVYEKIVEENKNGYVSTYFFQCERVIEK
ncbi:hypothetical protein KKB44_01255 [Candidatus Micrarchaeota archaeon]|nr:hypothetical protein [Candidatus Micrarchaeota archaeon]